jgi:uncharacterized protein (TIGR02391 family)
MAKRTGHKSPDDFTELKQFASTDEVDRAIRKLQNCLFEVQRLKSEYVRYDDQKTRSAELNIKVSILEAFGRNSPEYGEYKDHTIFQPQMAFVRSESQRIALENENQTRFTQSIPQTEEMLNSLIRGLWEKRTQMASLPDAQTRVAFQNLSLHPAIAQSCSNTYQSAHYREAVLNASIALVNLVKQKSGQYSLDGAGLMSNIFSANKPVLAFNELKDQTDKDEQEGLMHLFIGAVLALRNPRAHALFDDSPELALDYIAFLSMLAKRLETATRR